jgi:hypothetical protein
MVFMVPFYNAGLSYAFGYTHCRWRFTLSFETYKPQSAMLHQFPELHGLPNG